MIRMKFADAHPLTQHMALGCCDDVTWRGELCRFHDGFEAGLLLALAIAGIPPVAGLAVPA